MTDPGDQLTNRLKERLRACLPYLREVPDIDMSVELVDYGLDSMVGIDLLVDLEKTFAITFPDEFVSPDTFRSGESLDAAIRSVLATVGRQS
jgi:acyl carrier protein